MKKLLLICLLFLAGCSAKQDIKDYTVIYKNKDVYPGVSSKKMSDALFDSNIQYSDSKNKIETITLFNRTYTLKNKIKVGTQYKKVKNTYSSPYSNTYKNGKGTITYRYTDQKIQLKFIFKDSKVSVINLSKY